jgi:hypothetical protein
MAITQSNAQYDEEEVLNRLDIKLLEVWFTEVLD